MHMIINQRLLVADGMFYPVVVLISVVDYGDSRRIIGKPYSLFLIHIDIIDDISHHLVIAFVVGGEIRMYHATVSLNFVNPHTFGSN